MSDMRHIIFIFLFYGVVAVWAQVDTFLDIGVQNDFLNYRGHGTDRYYTGGNQVAIIFRTPPKRISYHRFSITQQLFTPDDLQDTSFRRQDYPYAGLLFFSYQAQGRLRSLRTLWAATSSWGYSGRRAGARKTQQLLHRAIGDEIPLGWDHIIENGFYGQLGFVLGQPLLATSRSTFFLYQAVEWGHLFQRMRWGLQFLRGSTDLPMGSFSIATQEKSSVKKRSAAVFITPTITRVFRNGLLQWQPDGVSVSDRTLCNEVMGLEFGIGVRAGRTVAQFVQYLQQREFRQADPHAFGEITIRVALFQSSQ
ncbi:MAG: DUF2219 family protein [Chitinophagales bacterium]|nr:DUF2219 family protein [Chitinophagales bacterium]